jgi:hypothetical protein
MQQHSRAVAVAAAVSQPQAVARRVFLAAVLMAAMVFGVAPISTQAAVGDWAAGPFATGDNSFDGFVDSPSNGSTVNGAFTITGWAVDKASGANTGIDEIHVYNGLAGAGTFLAKATVGVFRPDVGGALGNSAWNNAGFSAAVQAGQLPTGTHTLTVYIHSMTKGWWYRQFSVVLGSTVTVPTPIASMGVSNVNIASSQPFHGEKLHTQIAPNWVYEMAGYAVDTGASPIQGSQGSGISKVEVYINEMLVGEATLGYYNADSQRLYGQQFANSGYRLRFNPTKYATGNIQMQVRATSAVTGRVSVHHLTAEIVDTAPEVLDYPYVGQQ